MTREKLDQMKSEYIKNLDQIGHDFLRERKAYVDQDEETGLCALYPVKGETRE